MLRLAWIVTKRLTNHFSVYVSVYDVNLGFFFFFSFWLSGSFFFVCVCVVLVGLELDPGTTLLPLLSTCHRGDFTQDLCMVWCAHLTRTTSFDMQGPDPSHHHQRSRTHV